MGHRKRTETVHLCRRCVPNRTGCRGHVHFDRFSGQIWSRVAVQRAQLVAEPALPLSTRPSRQGTRHSHLLHHPGFHTALSSTAPWPAQSWSLPPSPLTAASRRRSWSLLSLFGRLGAAGRAQVLQPTPPSSGGFIPVVTATSDQLNH
jgi:hypothetical protein